MDPIPSIAMPIAIAIVIDPNTLDSNDPEQGP